MKKTKDGHTDFDYYRKLAEKTTICRLCMKTNPDLHFKRIGFFHSKCLEKLDNG